MKIKTKSLSYDEVLKLKPKQFVKTTRPNLFFRTLLRVISVFDFISAKFTFKRIGMEKLNKKEPCLILMNHSSFIDLEIAYKIFWPKPFSIVCTSDGFVGKSWLMRKLGCIPTNKFVTDVSLIADMLHSIKKNQTSVLMYPEASYSFDGCATPLPKKLGVLIKKLGVPVITVITEGAFLRDPLYMDCKNEGSELRRRLTACFPVRK